MTVNRRSGLRAPGSGPVRMARPGLPGAGGGAGGRGLWAFRKWGASRLPGAGGSRLKVEETLALGDRRFVSILKAG